MTLQVVVLPKLLSLPLIRHPEAVKKLQIRYQGDKLNDDRLRMADMPQGAILIDNPLSGAPGYQIDNIFVLAGVPSIMKGMLEGLIPRLTRGTVTHEQTLRCHLGEGIIASELRALQQRYDRLEIGSYPFYHERIGRDPPRDPWNFGSDDRTGTLLELAAILHRLGDHPD